MIADSEPVIVGFAAAVYPAVHAGSEATVDEAEAFIDAYCAARRTSFDRDDLECSWAAGLWNRAFDAKKQVAKGQAVRSLMRAVIGSPEPAATSPRPNDLTAALAANRPPRAVIAVPLPPTMN